MEIIDFWQIIKKRKANVFSICLVFFIFGLVLTFSQPLRYESKSRLLIIQNVSGSDPYTISKSNQYLSGLFAQVIYSNSFLDLVTNSQGFDVDKNYFQTSYKQQMKLWNKTVAARSLGDTGIIEISVYHTNPYQAKQLALAVNNVLINQSFNYQGSGENVKVKVIDQPLVSDYPVKPNIIFNLTAFLALGILASLTYLYLAPEKKRRYLENRQANDSFKIETHFNDLPRQDISVNNENQNNNYNQNQQMQGNIDNILNRFN